MTNSPQWSLLDLTTDNPEHDLFESVNVEFVDITGYPIKYYIKTNTDTSDVLYGEDTTSTYSVSGYDSKVVYEPSEDINVLDVFGFSPDNVLQYAMMPKAIFTRDIATPSGDSTLFPMVGDTIITLWNNKRYEITDIGAEQNIFLGKKMIWEFVLTPHRYSEDSASEESILDFEPDVDDFPSINDEGFETKPLSGYGDNQTIEDESNTIYNPDSDLYGY